MLIRIFTPLIAVTKVFAKDRAVGRGSLSALFAGNPPRRLRGRLLVFIFLSAVALAAVPAPGAAPSCTILRGGCGSPVQPQQCFADTLAPSPWIDPGSRSSQYILKLDSPNSNCHPPVTTGPPTCCASNPLAVPPPTLTNLRAVLIRPGDNTTPTDLYQISVDYDAPNYLWHQTTSARTLATGPPA